MSEQQDIVQPTDSVSNAPAQKARKGRPGKAQRAAARSSTTSQASASTAISSRPGQMMFGSKAFSTPIPQPGKFPIVFPSGAGEPTRDAFFALDGNSLEKCFSEFPKTYVNSSKYAEFSSHADIEQVQFAKELTTANILGVAQQVVHAHTNMGLPMGDFSSIGSTEVYNPAAARAVIHQFGEFSVESLGTRYLLKHYELEVQALVRTANRITRQDTLGGIATVLKQHWLPTSPNDKRTAFILASKIIKRISEHGAYIPIDSLSESIFAQAHTAYDAVKAVLPAGERNLYDRFFVPYGDPEAFAALFEGAAGQQILTNLGLVWNGNPGPGPLDFNLVAKTKFPELIQPWLRRKATVTRFFSCGSGLAEKTIASGSPAQLSEVETNAGVTVVRNLVAVSAPECSLLACFPACALLADGGVEKRVIQTTSVSTGARSTEFMQLDWM